MTAIIICILVLLAVLTATAFQTGVYVGFAFGLIAFILVALCLRFERSIR